MGPGGQRERWRGLADSGPRERGIQRAAGPEKEWAGGRGERKDWAFGPEAVGKVVFLFLYFFFYLKAFSNSFKNPFKICLKYFELLSNTHTSINQMQRHEFSNILLNSYDNF